MDVNKRRDRMQIIVRLVHVDNFGVNSKKSIECRSKGIKIKSKLYFEIEHATRT